MIKRGDKMAEPNETELNGEELIEFTASLQLQEDCENKQRLLIFKLARERNEFQQKYAAQHRISENLLSTIKFQKEEITELEIQLELNKNNNATGDQASGDQSSGDQSSEEKLVKLQQEYDKLNKNLAAVKSLLWPNQPSSTQIPSTLTTHSDTENREASEGEIELQSQPGPSSARNRRPRKTKRQTIASTESTNGTVNIVGVRTRRSNSNSVQFDYD